MVVKCWKENSALKECLIANYQDPAFYEKCKMEYLKERIQKNWNSYQEMATEASNKHAGTYSSDTQ